MDLSPHQRKWRDKDIIDLGRKTVPGRIIQRVLKTVGYGHVPLSTIYSVLNRNDVSITRERYERGDREARKLIKRRR